MTHDMAGPECVIAATADVASGSAFHAGCTRRSSSSSGTNDTGADGGDRVWIREANGVPTRPIAGETWMTNRPRTITNVDGHGRSLTTAPITGPYPVEPPWRFELQTYALRASHASSARVRRNASTQVSANPPSAQAHPRL
ncbi:MAG: hypothetical protein QOE52_2077 [Mycobacterium sp.]|jgi:hypothetical protein|nr:hypothetical protein [Mycobacterium sp.]